MGAQARLGVKKCPLPLLCKNGGWGDLDPGTHGPLDAFSLHLHTKVPLFRDRTQSPELQPGPVPTAPPASRPRTPGQGLLGTGIAGPALLFPPP